MFTRLLGQLLSQLRQPYANVIYTPRIITAGPRVSGFRTSRHGTCAPHFFVFIEMPLKESNTHNEQKRVCVQ